jgi:cystathionine gamma-lyase
MRSRAPAVHKGLDYGRSHNPTRYAYERCVAALEAGTDGFAFSSGMAATATVLELLDAGSHVVALDDLYGGTRRLFERVRKRSAGLRFTYIPFAQADELHHALQADTRMIWVESPSNPLLKLVDLEAVASIARARKIITVADNTFASPWVQRPLEMGFDLVVHSATKYLTDTRTSSVASVSRGPSLSPSRLAFLQNGHRLGSQSLRCVSGDAGTQDLGRAHGAPLRERDGRSPSDWRGTRRSSP